jgi:hypothetical protein
VRCWLCNSVLLTFGWGVTTTIGGEPISILLIIACFASGTGNCLDWIHHTSLLIDRGCVGCCIVVGSMSLVCFFPLAALFGSSAVTALSMGIITINRFLRFFRMLHIAMYVSCPGTGLCGFTSAVMALAQGVTNNTPRYLPG